MMGRRAKFSDREATSRFMALSGELKRRPTGREVAKAFGVSTRTAWRYLYAITKCRECPRCLGRGWIEK